MNEWIKFWRIERVSMPKSRQEDGARAKRESNSKLSNNKYVKWGMSNKQKKRHEKNCICARPYNSYEYSLVINRRKQQKKKKNNTGMETETPEHNYIPFRVL